MLRRSKQLEVGAAAVGMVLSEAVFDAHGNVLLPQGVVLDEALLASLQRRGIDWIAVADNAVCEAQLQAEKERLLQRLPVLFRNCMSKPGCTMLLDHIRAYRLQQIS